ncbi:hypothetical protein [Psychrobacter aestuarii]|uniref:Uncharacterized protein n=1 Tax=Psychrobacter aestuarii TaxID=556327 RepID=A0ABN0W2N8_9GAMM|nr:hypothetical protein [Psychrobacter aestuarii]
MSTQSDSSQTPSAGQQRRQATSLLLWLQWLVLLVLLIAVVWLYVSQQRFERKMQDRLQSNEQVVGRLNDMDDRLFAISQAAAPAPSAAPNNQAQNQLALLRIQIKAVDSLLLDNDYASAVELLRGLQWQLSQGSNEIAPALTIVLRQSLSKDIERLQAKAAQPSPWQLQNLAIQNLQRYLYAHKTKIRDGNRTTVQPLSARELVVSEVIMTLNLAMQSSNMHQKDQLISHLTQAREQLKVLVDSQPRQPDAKDKDKDASTENAPSTASNLSALPAPQSFSDVQRSIDVLIAAAPTPTPLFTNQVLAEPKR